MGTMLGVELREYGPASNLVATDVALPQLGDDEVMIEVKAAGVIYADVQLRSGIYPIRDLGLPAVPGHEVVGIVCRVGSDVRDVEVGARVSAEVDNGGYAEFAKAKANRLVIIPENVSFQQALVYSFNLPAAYLVYYHFGNIRPEDTVLIHSAAGGLGSMLTQIAKRAGNTVIALTSSNEKFEACRDNGADHVLNSSDGYSAAVMEITGGRGVDVCFNHIAGDTLQEDLDSLAFRAFWNFPGHLTDYLGPLDMSQLFRKAPTIVRSSMESYIGKAEFREALDFLKTWMEEGWARQEPGHIFPLHRAGEAHQLMESRRSVGKIALQVDAKESRNNV